MPDLSEIMKCSIGKISLEDVLAAAVTLLVCLVAVRLLLKLFRRLLGRTKLEARVRRYVMGGVKLVLYMLTVVFTAGSLGVDMTSLVALLSVGSLGVTLAAEDVLGNVAGGLVILSSHPFAIGDFIEAGSVSGTVEDISLNHTRIATPDGPIAMLPNKELASSQVTNYTLLGRRRSTWKLTAPYDVPTETVKEACLRAAAGVEGVLSDPAPAAYLTAFGESGVEFTIYCWAQFDAFWPVHFAMGEALRRSLTESGVEIPYNRLDVRVMEEPQGEARRV